VRADEKLTAFLELEAAIREEKKSLTRTNVSASFELNLTAGSSR